MSKPPIVIIDDDPDLCELMEDALGETYNVRLCHAVHEAPQLTIEHQPVLVILDINMPEENGLQLCQRLRSFSDAAVLLISGDDSEDLQRAAQQHPRAAFLAKPFAIQRLRDTAAALISDTHPD